MKKMIVLVVVGLLLCTGTCLAGPYTDGKAPSEGKCSSGACYVPDGGGCSLCSGLGSYLSNVVNSVFDGSGCILRGCMQPVKAVCGHPSSPCHSR